MDPRSLSAPDAASVGPAVPRFTDALRRVGPALFGAALAGFGVLCLVTGAPVPGLEPLPATLPGAAVLSFVTGFALIAGGAAAVAYRRAPRAALVVTGAVFLAWAVGLHLPRLLAEPSNGSVWTAAFEAAALGGAAWVLAWPPAVPGRPPSDTRGTALGTAGRLAFGAALVVFGVLHLVYRDFVALLVPAWIPAKLFWAVFTGVVHLAAGLAVLTGVLAGPATLAVGAMFGGWVLVLHAPRVLRMPADPKEWSSLFVALGMCGGAWLLAARFPERARRTAEARVGLRGRGARGRPAPTLHATPDPGGSGR